MSIRMLGCEADVSTNLSYLKYSSNIDKNKVDRLS